MSEPRVIVLAAGELRRFQPVNQAWEKVDLPELWDDYLIDATDEVTGELFKIHIRNQRGGASWLGGT